jgi:hypothetical protein
VEAIVSWEMETMNRGTENDGVPVGLVVLSAAGPHGPARNPHPADSHGHRRSPGQDYVERSRVLQRRIIELGQAGL